MGGQDYYYADGRKVAIDRDDAHVCVDLARAEGGSQVVHAWLKRVRSQPLSGRLALVASREIPKNVFHELEERSALQPVYRHGGALLVVLPEVRIEIGGGRRRRLSSFIAEGSVPSKVDEDKADLVVAYPLSGRGADALALANAVYEEFKPPLAQARFLRVVKKPEG
jgi:hypothetical protein